ncbi:transmembrane protein 199 [Nematostella vectensis]|uniref:transmembrane protein 199 n=1 Tax=Nematostella vectensis TaxID=45351 RepID=UPI0020775580|nr:transmembrane protein 199 [Nematostella vectensis]
MAVEVTLTPKLHEAIQRILESSDLSKTLREKLTTLSSKDAEKESEKRHIMFGLVKEIWQQSKAFRTEDDRPAYLHEMLEGSELYVEPPRPPERNPELVARLNKLRAKQEQIQYDQMVANVGPALEQKQRDTLGAEVRSTSRQVSSIVNFVLSVGAAFMFGFASSQFAFQEMSMRVIIGTFLAIIVAIADLYFMARTEI